MIKAICIDDSNIPKCIPDAYKIKLGHTYTITHIYNMVKQEGILGCDLREISLLDLNLPYECWKLDRFGINLCDMAALLELARNCAELDDFNIEELFEEQLVLLEEGDAV